MTMEVQTKTPTMFTTPAAIPKDWRWTHEDCVRNMFFRWEKISLEKISTNIIKTYNLYIYENSIYNIRTVHKFDEDNKHNKKDNDTFYGHMTRVRA